MKFILMLALSVAFVIGISFVTIGLAIIDSMVVVQ